jgi:DNA topoisomerase-1
MYELIITEKPSAAKKIADALADGKALKVSEKGVPYYKVTHGNKDIVVACAVGHLYTVAEKGEKKWTYPVFEIEWVQSSKQNKASAFTSKYATAIRKLTKGATEYTVATDYDIEGEVIGLNVIRYLCKQKDANRMKFSTLTKPDLVKSYDNKQKTLDWGQANAGETRHFLDWLYGINLSRALTASIKATGRYKVMSSGRVQGPALKLVVDKEKEIQAFIPEPYWQIQLLGLVDNFDYEAFHAEDKIFDKKRAEEIMSKIDGAKKGIIKDVEKNQFKQQPPIPFDLTSLQIECYRVHRISPKETLALAQDLYIAGLISYPRTSSQQLPKEIGYKKILEQLKRQQGYSNLCTKLLSKPTLTPNNGKKTDPAHPAIYPTGILGDLGGRKAKLYDLIVRRFLATFSEPATRETVKWIIDVNSEELITKGTTTIDKGWHEFYGPYVKLEEQQLPPVEKGKETDIKELNKLDKETTPPKRYTPSSIIRELEKRNLGTKATRATIVDTLFQRGYCEGTPIKATELGIHTADTLEKFSPQILDEELTRHFEEEMEDIRNTKKKSKEVLDEAKGVLTKILDGFKKQEKDVGDSLYNAHRETLTKTNTVGKCPTCDEGTLMIRKGKYGKFIACDAYPKCKTTFKLPSTGTIKTSKKICESCNYPMISVLNKKRKQDVCINENCPSKKVQDKDKVKELKAIHHGEIERTCPTCKKGKLVLRKSIYGAFYGCSNYPKCKFTEKIEENNENNKE